MAADGWELTKVNVPQYTFKKSTPNEYIYRLELLDPKLSKKNVKIISILLKKLARRKLVSFLIGFIFVKSPNWEHLIFSLIWIQELVI